MSDSEEIFDSSFDSDFCPSDDESSSTISEDFKPHYYEDLSEHQEFIEIHPSCQNPAPCRFLFIEVPAVNVPSTSESNEEDILIFYE